MLNNISRFSVYKFKDENSIYFNPTEYSKFKFGCKDAARHFGHILAKDFASSINFPEIALSNKEIVVLSSAYTHLPTASFAMKDYFIRTFNSILIDLGKSPVHEAKMYRKSSYKEEYGEMSKDQRLALMGNDLFYVDINFIKDKICIFIDDVKITGAHEIKVIETLEHLGLPEMVNVNFLYLAELIDNKTNPKIENYLNYYFVKNLLCLDKIIKNDEFIMNTRVVKYILNSPHEECKIFLQYQKYMFLHTLYHNALGNAYHLIEDYQLNLNYLKTLL